MRRSWDPAAVLAELARGSDHCGTPPIRIDRDGRWWHEGRLIPRPELVRLFASALWRAPDGRHWLLTPVERVPVEVEDTPFLVVEMRTEGEGRERIVRMRTNLGDEVEVDEDHPLTTDLGPNGTPIPRLRLGRGLDARLTRAVYYELAELALHDGGEERPGIWSCGCFFPLGGE